MRVVRIHEDVAGAPRIAFHHLTDLHVGAPDFAEDEFIARRKLIEDDPYARWTMGGDGGDLIRFSDRRYSPTELAPRYRNAVDARYATIEHLVELFSPIADKCWGWADGNHERVMDNYYGGKVGVEVCCALGIQDKWVGYRGFISISFNITSTQRKALLIDLQHGWQVGRLKGGPHVQAEREFSTTDADILLRGHNHQPAAHTFVTLGVPHGGQEVTRRYRTMINGGSWRYGYRVDTTPVDPEQLSQVEGDLWHETKGFRAEPVGGPVVLLKVFGNRGIKNGKRYGPGTIEHTTIENHIDAASLGLAVT